MLYDFHTHTLHSDGVLTPVELVRRAVVNGYRAVGIADHLGPGNIEEVLRQLVKDCQVCERHWDIAALPGVELTHVPAGAIAEIARYAKQLGARFVVVHGETLVEPVEPGTNSAAVRCRDVDIVAHPGLITLEEARLAAANGICLEITPRRGHCLTNGHVTKVAREAGAKLLLNTDAHEPGDLMTADFARQVAQGAGLLPGEIEEVLEQTPSRFLLKVSRGAMA